MPQAGLYPCVPVYEGEVDANLEWASIVDGERILLNDRVVGRLRAFRTRSGSPIDLFPDGVPNELTLNSPDGGYARFYQRVSVEAGEYFLTIVSDQDAFGPDSGTKPKYLMVIPTLSHRASIQSYSIFRGNHGRWLLSTPMETDFSGVIDL